MNANNSNKKKFDVVIVGAGPAGLGVGILLKKLDLDFIILEKNSIGASFKKWPQETCFISPSFTGNFFKMPDLNAITPDTSPAYRLLTEHPTGEDYVEYLEDVSRFYDLPIKTNIEVFGLEKHNDVFLINTNDGEYKSTYLIWAAGEYQYPNLNTFPGSDLCLHYSHIEAFSELEGEDRIVIGAYESGFDAMINLTLEEKHVTLIDDSNYFDLINSDSSYSLSPFTRDRIDEVIDLFDYHTDSKVISVELDKGQYIVKTANNKTFISPYKPINCTGFSTSLRLVNNLFDFEDGYPVLNNVDESTKTENLFLVGPQVKHGSALFCFIYKYRQRFAIVAESISGRESISQYFLQEVIHEYIENNFYLDDLSCCDDECIC